MLKYFRIYVDWGRQSISEYCDRIRLNISESVELDCPY
jgi:hypothetical protein